jgi:DNA-binding LytR/AlgR family response regulator
MVNTMVIKLEQDESVNNIEVKITYKAEAKYVDRLLSLLKTLDDKIECYLEDGLKLINISDIYYIESLDNKTLVFCEKNKYQTKLRLYQLVEKLSGSAFIQISKYCIMNTNKLDSVRPLFNSRMEVTLSNGVRLYVTRKYLAGMKQIFL